jgi:negative regulator of sigma E activity
LNKRESLSQIIDSEIVDDEADGEPAFEDHVRKMVRTYSVLIFTNVATCQLACY